MIRIRIALSNNNVPHLSINNPREPLSNNNMEKMHRSLTEIAQRISKLQESIPDISNTGDNETIDHLVSDIVSIEEEWLIDPEQRERFSVFTPDEP